MPDRHPDEQASTGPTPGKVRWGYLAFAIVVIGAYVWAYAAKDRAQRNLKALCTEEYAHARTAADTTTIDRRVLVPYGGRSTGGITCRQYRRG
jgi:hypothetical protein